MPITEASQARNGSDLCLACGLCCHGVLHNQAELQADEVEKAKGLGLEIEREADRLFFGLPCRHVSGASCTVYENRFATCREYRCGLLNNYLAERVSQEEALVHIGEAKRLLKLVRDVLPPGTTLRTARREWRERSASWAERGPPDKLTGELHLRLTMLQMFLDKHMRNDSERGAVVRHD